MFRPLRGPSRTQRKRMRKRIELIVERLSAQEIVGKCNTCARTVEAVALRRRTVAIICSLASSLSCSKSRRSVLLICSCSIASFSAASICARLPSSRRLRSTENAISIWMSPLIISDVISVTFVGASGVWQAARGRDFVTVKPSSSGSISFCSGRQACPKKSSPTTSASYTSNHRTASEDLQITSHVSSSD
jgi:hypothetical protein